MEHTATQPSGLQLTAAHGKLECPRSPGLASTLTGWMPRGGCPAARTHPTVRRAPAPQQSGWWCAWPQPAGMHEATRRRRKMAAVPSRLMPTTRAMPEAHSALTKCHHAQRCASTGNRPVTPLLSISTPLLSISTPPLSTHLDEAELAPRQQQVLPIHALRLHHWREGGVGSIVLPLLHRGQRVREGGGAHKEEAEVCGGRRQN